MANRDHLAILKEGANDWNDWREKKKDIIPDLSQASLARA
jgi:hypothetical protein